MSDDQHQTGATDATSTPDDGAPGADEASEVTAKNRRSMPIWQESILLVGAAVVLAILIKALLVQAFYIPSASMEPGLVNNDRILVQKPSYWFGGEPSRGDVVVFEDPGGWLGVNEDTEVSGVPQLLSKIGLYPTGGHLVKRVIGVAGDTITCCDEQGRILVNGVPLDEDAYIDELPEGTCNGPMIATCDWTAGPVPEGTIFVMGDNRDDSADSSYHLCLVGETDCTDNPYVDTDLVVGKAFALVWPLSRFSFLSDPSSFDDVPAAG